MATDSGSQDGLTELLESRARTFQKIDADVRALHSPGYREPIQVRGWVALVIIAVSTVLIGVFLQNNFTQRAAASQAKAALVRSEAKMAKTNAELSAVRGELDRVSSNLLANESDLTRANARLVEAQIELDRALRTRNVLTQELSRLGRDVNDVLQDKSQLENQARSRIEALRDENTTLTRQLSMARQVAQVLADQRDPSTGICEDIKDMEILNARVMTAVEALWPLLPDLETESIERLASAIREVESSDPDLRRLTRKMSFILNCQGPVREVAAQP